MSAPRWLAKQALEAGMVGAGLDRFGRWLRRNRVTVLAYHNVVPDSEPQVGDTSLHLPVRRFAQQLDALSQVGNVLPLTDVLACSRPRGRRSKHAFAITFDDAYRGALTLGVRELERRGLPATIFVAPGLLGNRMFWWDTLLTGPDAEMRRLRERVLTETDGTIEGAVALLEAGNLEAPELPESRRSASEAELEEAALVPGIMIGSHSWSHASLVRIGGGTLQRELSRPRAWLRDRFGPAYLDALAYPYGFHSAPVQRAARESGYRAAFALHPGSIALGLTPDEMGEAFRLPRLNVPAGLSPRKLRLRAAWS